MKFVAIDWGTSSFRAWLIEHDQILDQIWTEQGVKNFSSGNHAQYLHKVLKPWNDQLSFIISIGMIGSSIGLHETKFSELPLDINGVSDSLIRVSDFAPPLYIVPGASKSGDVMRGEESQSLAAKLENGLVILPGTHSKWIQIKDSQIIDFRTYFTGELFELLKNHSTLSKAIDSLTPSVASQDFLEGLDAQTTDLTHDLFSIRAKWLQGKSQEASREFLSGLLIGAEIKSAKTWSKASTAIIIASDSLAHIYLQALAHFGIAATVQDNKKLIEYFISLAHNVEDNL